MRPPTIADAEWTVREARWADTPQTASDDGAVHPAERVVGVARQTIDKGLGKKGEAFPPLKVQNLRGVNALIGLMVFVSANHDRHRVGVLPKRREFPFHLQDARIPRMG